jgi:aminopeptidase
MNEQQLTNYARLLLKVGVNLQPKQDLVINAEIEAKDLVEALTILAYKEFSSGTVHVGWRHGKLQRAAFDYASDDVLLDVPKYTIARLEEMLERGAALLSITGSDPELMKGVDAEKIGKSTKVNSQKTQFFSAKVMNNELRWNVAAMPTVAWAKKVFPDLVEEAAMDRLWTYIFKATRADLPDPLAAWADHLATLDIQRTFLNDQRFTTLHYQGPGTDLYVDMSDKQNWVSGGGHGADGVTFVANIPTEEVFSAPKRDGVNGRLAATMPLNLRGVLVKDFWFEFKDGKVVDYGASEGKEQLDKLFETDEGSKYLGEIAIVAHTSPIQQLGVIFFNTLFDENAACHFAFGRGYPECLVGGSQMNQEELLAAGLNQSLSHVDFMVGSEQLSIDGIDKNNHVTPIFRNGVWAIENKGTT